MTSVVTNEGEVKMNSNSPTCSSSLRSASNAKIENVEAAMRILEAGVISALRSSPSNSLMLSMIFMCHPAGHRFALEGSASAASPRQIHASTSLA